MAGGGGDAASLEAIYRSSVGRIHARFLRFADTQREAEDLVQETFIRAFTNLSTFRGESALSTWIERIAINVAAEWMRKTARTKLWIDAVDDPASHERPALETPELAGKGDLQKALATLPKGARAVLLLHDVEGYEHNEIAELLDVSVGTSKSQLHRARRLLREALQ